MWFTTGESARNEGVQAPMDFNIITRWQVARRSREFHTLTRHFGFLGLSAMSWWTLKVKESPNESECREPLDTIVHDGLDNVSHLSIPRVVAMAGVVLQASSFES